MRRVILAAVIVAAAAPVRADDLAGRWGVGGALAAASPIGVKWVEDRNDTGLGLGAWLRYGFAPRWTGGVAYDNLAFSRGPGRLETLQANAAYALAPESEWNPNVHVGVGSGWARGVPSKGPGTFTSSLGLGIDKFVLPDFSVGGTLDWFYAAHRGAAAHDIHATRVGLTAGFWFGGGKKAAPKTAAAPAPTPAPAPVATPVTIALNPASAELAQGESRTFSAAVTGAADKSVVWSVSPAVGAVSPAGVYTAPANVPVAQTVTVTAASAADPSKTASAEVRLKAPETISIDLAVRFDTAKSVVKPEYDSELKKVADFMKAYPSTKAAIEGHTDNVGKPEANKKLSQARADAVRQALIERFGADGARLTATGYGPEKPLADNATPEGRAKNRRVVATFSAAK